MFTALVAFGVGALGSRPVTGQAGAPTVEEHETVMTEIRPAFRALRTSLEGQDAEDVAKQAGTIAKLLVTVEAFWTARKAEDAIGFVQTAREAASSIETAAQGKDLAAAGDGAKALGGQCGSCHDVYREELPDGTYVLKEDK